MPVDPDDFQQDVGPQGSLIELELPVGLDKKDKKARRAILERAAQKYGADFVSKLQAVRDPKERILFAAEAVFAQNGFGGARTQEIADLAGVNKAMIHYYFDSKEKLYHAILDQILFDLIKLTQEQLTCGNQEPAELVRRFFLGYFDYVASHRHFSRITAMEMGSQDRYLARITETFFKPLFDRGVAFIQAGIEAGVFNKIDPRKLLVTIYAMAMAYFSDAEFIAMVLGQDPLEEKLLKEHKHFLLDMIFSMLLRKNR